MSNTLIVIIGISFIFLMTSLGSAVVFFFKKDITPKLYTIFLGFAAGVMIAASVWSLILPALEYTNGYGNLNWAPIAVGFIAGGLFLVCLDKLILRIQKSTNNIVKQSESFRKSFKLFVAVTVHNIPEGLAVGFAFGAAIVTNEPLAYMTALGLAIGIGVQNFPEGAAISLPMKKETNSNLKAFLYGLLSGIVEPIFALIGLLLASILSVIMPWLLSFAAGAMIFVVAEDLIPDSKLTDKPKLGVWFVMLGFVAMMILDIALG